MITASFMFKLFFLQKYKVCKVLFRVNFDVNAALSKNLRSGLGLKVTSQNLKLRLKFRVNTGPGAPASVKVNCSFLSFCCPQVKDHQSVYNLLKSLLT